MFTPKIFASFRRRLQTKLSPVIGNAKSENRSVWVAGSYQADVKQI